MEAIGWTPHLHKVYRGWNNRGSTGIVNIHIGEDRYNGTFLVDNNSVTIFYQDGYEGRQLKVPRDECRFSKHISRRMRIYNVYLEGRAIDSYSVKTKGKTTTEIIDAINPGVKMVDDEETEQLETSGGIDLTGKKDMIAIRNHYQKQLDKDYGQIKNLTDYLNRIRNDIRDKRNRAEGLKESIDDHMKERDRVFTDIQNSLNKEEKYENEMLDKTLTGMKARNKVIVKQKMKDVDIDTQMLGTAEQFKRLYPHYGTAIFSNKKEMEEKEREIRQAAGAYKDAVVDYKNLLETADKNIQDVRDAFARYEKDFRTGDSEVKSCRYYNSFLYKREPKSTKILLNLDVLKHDIDGLRNTLKVIEKDFSKYENTPLETMSY
ncbi:MAG: hypothetical protein M1448_00370 [Candidatus Marsarchaeota archaeon]|jgi:hypothetical protein|nr:hypothetical protein [Candidatus Marsarchaeota archaeon]